MWIAARSVIMAMGLGKIVFVVDGPDVPEVNRSLIKPEEIPFPDSLDRTASLTDSLESKIPKSPTPVQGHFLLR